MSGAGPTDVVLCAVIRQDDDGAPTVLLGVKKRGFATGKTVLPGGKVEAGESGAQAAVRELHEETGLSVAPGELSLAATIQFVFPAQPAADMSCRVYRVAGRAAEASGAAHDTDELAVAWHRADDLPLADTWQDAARWLPEVIASPASPLQVRVELADDNETVADYRTGT
ncbi:8-oxo-dGTP diphosphatase [Zhihengliuella halotolerans]|uniref:8-oxo-dGTP diphosphatase n=1 Tax=Zhihengliuella halotolerans TaxID=370736 RepID=UPI000C80FCDF|nr:NUDIX domain-containing protein [Zhihengliuella halotolerans]